MDFTFLQRGVLIEWLSRLSADFPGPGNIYLIGETSQLLEGWLPWAEQLEFCTGMRGPGNEGLTAWTREFQGEKRIRIRNESPADIIPLPEGYERRHRPLADHVLLENEAEQEREARRPSLQFYHFDPYSVSFRFLARGDESDYALVLKYLEQRWITVEGMEQLLEELLPRFTRQSIQQDPAEFRRKYKGLLQMWRSISSRGPGKSSGEIGE